MTFEEKLNAHLRDAEKELQRLRWQYQYYKAEAERLSKLPSGYLKVMGLLGRYDHACLQYEQLSTKIQRHTLRPENSNTHYMPTLYPCRNGNH
jgi:hypothetical protein